MANRKPREFSILIFPEDLKKPDRNFQYLLKTSGNHFPEKSRAVTLTFLEYNELRNQGGISLQITLAGLYREKVPYYQKEV